MANLTNPVASTASFAMISSSRTLRNQGQMLATGSKGASDIVDYVVGSSLATSVTVLNGVTKGSTYGGRMLNVAQNSLMSAKTTLVNLRNIIAQSNTATGNTLTQLQALYAQGVADAYRLVTSAQFDTRNLFDGSLANATGNAQNAMAPNGSSLNIRVGELMTNTVNISVPRLLSGNGQQADVAAPGFQPLFPITAQAVADSILAVAQLVAVATIAPGANAIAAQGVVAGLALPAANVNPIGNVIMAAAQTAAAGALIAANPIYTADIVGANNVLNTALNAALAAAAPYINADSLSAISLILNAETGIVVGTTGVEYDAMITGITAPNTAVGTLLIAAAKGAAVGAGGAGAFVAEKTAVLTAAITAPLVGASATNSVSGLAQDTIHNILAPANQTAADAIISAAVLTVTAQISAIGGQMQILQQAGDDIQSLINVDDEAAGDYLNTNYEDSATIFKSELLALQGSIYIIKQGFDVAQAALALLQ